MRIAIRAGLKPEPLITVTQWADLKRVLTSESSAEAGRYRSSRTPYLREMMDDLSEFSGVEEVINCKGAQLGVTEAALNWMGYTIDVSPCPFLLVEPTKDVVELVSKTRIQPMIDNTPALSAKVKPARSRDSGNTLTKKEFPGGIARMVGANSAAGLRNMPVKRLVLDEVDAYPLDLDGEGNPIDLARKRTATYAKRKIFILSTPTIKGISLIEKLFEATDKRYYFLACPECAGLQHLKWDNLRYNYDAQSKIASDVVYECEHCSYGIEEKHKPKMLADGRWIATDIENKNTKRKGYHINSMYSPWRKWSEMACDWEEAQGDEMKLKTFYNIELALAYESSGEKPEWNEIKNRALDYKQNTIPSDDIAFITVGADVQKDRIELEIVGWCEGKVSYSIDYRVLHGYTAGDDTEVWRQFASVLEEQWIKPNGSTLPVAKMCIDSQGHSTSEVYAFCNSQSSGKVVPIRGKGLQSTIVSAPKPVHVSIRNKPIGQTKVWHVGINIIKAELYGWLKVEEGTNGYCYFPLYSDEYFKGLTAEELVITKDKKGNDIQAWVRKYKRNEPLDCRVYARAAANMIGMDSLTAQQWANLRMAGQTTTNKKPKRKSEYWDK